MSEKIIVKLRRDNISVSSCKEGVYLTFDAENRSSFFQLTKTPFRQHIIGI